MDWRQVKPAARGLLPIDAIHVAVALTGTTLHNNPDKHKPLGKERDGTH